MLRCDSTLLFWMCSQICRLDYYLILMIWKLIKNTWCWTNIAGDICRALSKRPFIRHLQRITWMCSESDLSPTILAKNFLLFAYWPEAELLRLYWLNNCKQGLVHNDYVAPLLLKTSPLRLVYFTYSLLVFFCFYLC